MWYFSSSVVGDVHCVSWSDRDDTKQLDHPNVVRIYEAGQHENWLYLVMEYISGATVESFIKKHGPFDWKATVKTCEFNSDVI